MKAYFAIFLFLCLAFKPVYTIGYISYFKLNINEIVDKYCENKEKPQMQCNGKCHLSKRLSFGNSQNSETNNEAITLSVSEAFLPVYIEGPYSYTNLMFDSLERNKKWLVLIKNDQIDASITVPPPQV